MAGGQLTHATRIGLAVDDVLDEIQRARSLHGEVEFHSAHEGFAVMDEERDELWEEVKRNWRKTKTGEKITNPGALHFAQGQHKRAMYTEAIQIAAMAIRFAAEVCDDGS